MEWNLRCEKRTRFAQSFVKVVLGLSVLLFVAGMSGAPAWADDDEGKYGRHKGHHPNPSARLEKLSQKLSLTEDQQNKILPILEEKANRIQALHEQMKGLRKQMKEVRQETRTKIEAELTEEQKTKFQEMREKHKERKKQMHKRKHRRDQHEKHDDKHDD